MPDIENNKVIINQSKWESPIFWGTIATSIVGILSLVGFWSWVGVEQDLVLKIIGGIVAVASQIVGNWNDADVKNAWGVR
jgi:hypothetical protein